jgi:hypothetical protein
VDLAMIQGLPICSNGHARILPNSLVLHRASNQRVETASSLGEFIRFSIEFVSISS